MDQSNCADRETQLEEEAAVLVCLNVDYSMLVSSKVRKQRLCVQPGEARHLRARCQPGLTPGRDAPGPRWGSVLGLPLEFMQSLSPRPRKMQPAPASGPSSFRQSGPESRARAASPPTALLRV